MVVDIALTVFSLILLGICTYLYSAVEELKAFRKMVEQRFFEAGINLDQVITTSVKMPDQWVETEGMDDIERDDAVMSTGVLRSKGSEWIEH
jgi:hypothetical protein